MNRATRIIVATVGCMLGLAGMDHGIFETLHGNTLTNSLVIQAIGEAHRMWLHGTEEAFTIIPNFLLTGMLAIIVSITIIVWSVGFIHKKHGPAVFLLLFILLFLVGGGVGQVVFFIPTWLASTRINNPLTWWRKVFPGKIRQVLAKCWPFSLFAVLICFLIALEIAIFGFFPGVDNPDTVLAICWSFLLAAWVLLLFTFVNGFAYDIQHQTGK
jgi:hypothetical protein